MAMQVTALALVVWNAVTGVELESACNTHLGGTTECVALGTDEQLNSIASAA
jgi:hypothetical protein